jgi:hypothetical protein
MPVTCTSILCFADTDTFSIFDSAQPFFFIDRVACYCCITTPAAPSLGLLVMSSSLIRYGLVQVYHRHLCSRVRLNDLSGWLPCVGPFTRIEAWAAFPSFRLGDRVTLYRPSGSPQGLPSGHVKFLFGHWPASYVCGQNCECCVDGVPDLLHDRWWVTPCQGAPISRLQDRRISLPNTRLARVKPTVSWVDSL